MSVQITVERAGPDFAVKFGYDAALAERKGIMNPFIAIGGMVAILTAFLVAGAIDYNTEKVAERPTYSYPTMEAPCREPVPEKELRIWIDKRLSETEGVRSCRVIPISRNDSPRKAWKKAMKS